MAGGGNLAEGMLRAYQAIPGGFDSPEFLKCVLPSGSGVSHALALARLFAPLACDGELSTKFGISFSLKMAQCQL